MKGSRLPISLFLIVSFAAACYAAGSGPTPSHSVSPAATPLATSVVSDTIYPETPHPDATPTPIPPETPYPTPLPAGMAEMIYALVALLGPPDWCDPDFYPIARAEQLDLAKDHLAEMQADVALYAAIVEHNGFDAAAQLTDEQLVKAYGDWKILTKAIVLTPLADGYSFDYTALRGDVAQQTDHHVAGTISGPSAIEVAMDEQTSAPSCPICLARNTLIDTPNGPIEVDTLREGDAVWTVDGSGRRIAAPVAALGSTPVSPAHKVVRLVLMDGRTLDVSPGHPLADGSPVGRLGPGDFLDGSTVASAQLVTYSGGSTFDLLPASITGTYWANGILVGSTLKKL